MASVFGELIISRGGCWKRVKRAPLQWYQVINGQGRRTRNPLREREQLSQKLLSSANISNILHIPHFLEREDSHVNRLN